MCGRDAGTADAGGGRVLMARGDRGGRGNGASRSRSLLLSDTGGRRGRGRCSLPPWLFFCLMSGIIRAGGVWLAGGGCAPFAQPPVTGTGMERAAPGQCGPKGRACRSVGLTAGFP